MTASRNTCKILNVECQSIKPQVRVELCSSVQGPELTNSRDKHAAAIIRSKMDTVLSRLEDMQTHEMEVKRLLQELTEVSPGSALHKHSRLCMLTVPCD